MIVDFQHHYTPRELFKADPDAGNRTYYDENRVPSYSFHSLLYDLDEHIAMMDVAGIDAAVLSYAEGMCGPLESCRIANDKIYEATQNYPGQFIGTAHAHPLGGPDAFKELARCKNELGFPPPAWSLRPNSTAISIIPNSTHSGPKRSASAFMSSSTLP